MALSREQLQSLPRLPGVYLFEDSAGQLLYIGKAKDLRRRVSSYFAPQARHLRRIARMVRKVAAVQTITTLTEQEALAHEANLIRERQPPYNVALKMDRPSGFLRLSIHEDFPRLDTAQETQEDGALYFGPYTSPSAMLMLKDTVDQYFQLRKQPIQITEHPRKPCWNYQIRRCHAPCAGRISPDEYRPLVEEVVRFLKGEREELLGQLQDKMLRAASRHEYEWAARYRDQRQALQRLFDRQETLSPEPMDRDVLAAAADGDLAVFCMLTFRKGRLMGMQTFPFQEIETEELPEATESVLKQYYSSGAEIPPEILVDRPLPDARLLKRWLSQQASRPVRLHQPGRQTEQRQIAMAAKNAELALKTSLTASGPERTLARLKQALSLQKTPKRIECIDISHFQGQDIVASLVVCIDGKMDRTRYRRYKIEGLTQADDFASMAQVVSRRLERLQRERQTFPDLILVDGGPLQLQAAQNALAETPEGHNIELAAIAKARPKAPEPEQRRERIYRPQVESPLFLEDETSGMLLLQHIRDEAHRFALTYQRSLRSKRLLDSELDKIPGVGSLRRRELLRALGSVSRIASASVDELRQVSGISASVAQRIFDFFRD